MTDLTSATRRTMLAAMAAASVGALMPGRGLLAQGTAPRRRIDVHHHFFPPEFLDAQRAAMVEAGRPPNLIPAMANWTVQRSLEEMDKHGIGTAILSISSSVGTKAAPVEQVSKLARACNDHAAKLVKDYPGKFGLFGYLPMPYVDASLKEIEYAYNTLKADGIGMMTSYMTSAGEEKWLGDPSFAPVFDEINRRKGIVFVHLGRIGGSSLCCGNVVQGVPDVMTETPQFMTRALTSLLFNGHLSRCPDIRFIFTNAGGTVPVLAARLIATSRTLGDDFKKLVPNGIEPELKKLYYDVSNAASAGSLAALSKLVPASQVVFGSDYPYVPIPVTTGGIDGFSYAEAELEQVYRGNAVKLVPRLA